MGAVISTCFPSLFCTLLSSCGPTLHFYAFGLDRGGRNRNLGIRRRGWLIGVNGAAVAGTVWTGETSPFPLCRPFFDQRPRSRTPSGFITGPPVGPWTRSIVPAHRAHRTRGAPSQPAQDMSRPVSGNTVNPRSAKHILQFSPCVFWKSTHGPTSVQ